MPTMEIFHMAMDTMRLIIANPKEIRNASMSAQRAIAFDFRGSTFSMVMIDQWYFLYHWKKGVDPRPKAMEEIPMDMYSRYSDKDEDCPDKREFILLWDKLRHTTRAAQNGTLTDLMTFSREANGDGTPNGTGDEDTDVIFNNYSP